MNNIEFYKRVITSIILLPITIICIFFSKYLFLIFLILIAIISLIEWYLIYKKINNAVFAFGSVLIFISIISAYNLRGDNLDDVTFFMWVLFICFFSDVGGYTFGKIIGGKKLSKISPNKTVSGALGSIIFSFIPILIINYQIYFDTSLDLTLPNLILSLIVSVICQLGDILVSYFKRIGKIKNTGNILPGHGGLLDRIDGILFVLPIVFLFKFLGLI